MSNPRNTLASPRLGRMWLLGLLAAVAISAAVWGPVTLPSFDFARTDDGEYHLLRLFLLGWQALATRPWPGTDPTGESRRGWCSAAP